jgi:hypothetical protein
MARIMKITAKGIVLSEGTGHKEVKLPNGKSIKTYESGRLGFLVSYNSQELGFKVGDQFPIPVRFTDEKIVDKSTGAVLPLVWCKL